MRDDTRSLEDLEATHRSVRAVQQVVRALESLSRAQRGPVAAVTADATTYLDWIDEVIVQLAGPAEERADADRLYVLIGPERGFCGALAHAVADQIPAEGALGVVGTRLAEVLDERSELGSRLRFWLPAASAVEELTPAAIRLARRILDERHTGPVLLLHPREGSPALETATLLAAPRRLARRLEVETWSPPHRVLEAAVSESVTGRLVVALAETLRSEVSARLAATGAARQACERRLEELRRAILSERQEQTTRELLEVVASHLAGGSERAP